MPPPSPLRPEFERALAAELEGVGPEAFTPEPVVAAFRDRVTKGALYKWHAAWRASGKPSAQVVEKIRDAAAARAERTPEPAREIAAEVADHVLARPLRAEEVASAGGLIPIVQMIQECIDLARELVRDSRDPETGKVKLRKTALAANDQLRRSLETAVRLAESMRAVQRVDEFNALVVAEIEKLAPETAERLLGALHRLTCQWNGTA